MGHLCYCDTYMYSHTMESLYRILSCVLCLTTRHLYIDAFLVELDALGLIRLTSVVEEVFRKLSLKRGDPMLYWKSVPSVPAAELVEPGRTWKNGVARPSLPISSPRTVAWRCLTTLKHNSIAQLTEVVATV